MALTKARLLKHDFPVHGKCFRPFFSHVDERDPRISLSGLFDIRNGKMWGARRQALGGHCPKHCPHLLWEVSVKDMIQPSWALLKESVSASAYTSCFSRAPPSWILVLVWVAAFVVDLYFAFFNWKSNQENKSSTKQCTIFSVTFGPKSALGTVREPPTCTTYLKSTVEYASNLYRSTPPICNTVPCWLLSLEERETPHYTSNFYCSTPPICTAEGPPFVPAIPSHSKLSPS